ncbi:HEPN domain-containing protein [Variovorax saccharolyticus]|uniref:HEPN domain-containing protein n=1 Tax=Variovorax saccharolyticus TaxID=3053516 RepID=UPI0025771A6E|nr:HEPN domain-containing protein [Variovorax sp. J31P216]MDM0025924.1 HEPN domain-containing protein [Variovorax sp. J31P216]
MDALENLSQTLTKLVEFASDPPECEGYDPSSADYALPRQHRVTVDAERLAELVRALDQVSWLRDFVGGLAYSSPSGYSSISLEGVAHWLLAQARTRPATECIEDLQRYFAENISTVLEVIPVWGLAPKHQIDLGDGIRIVPVSELPPSKLKDLFRGVKRHHFSFDLANASPRPGAAVIKESLHGPLYQPNNSAEAAKSRRMAELIAKAFSNGGAPVFDESMMKEIAGMSDPLKAARESTSISGDAEELLTVVALLCPRPLFPLGQWHQRPGHLPLVGQIGGYSGPTNDLPFYVPIDPTDYPISEIESLVNSYRKLPSETRKRLKTPLRRLNQGRRELAHGTVEDAAVDLGIAAEALLTQDRDSDAPIGYLLRTRGVLLLGGSPEERRQHYHVLRELYTLRSTAAHTGEIADTRQIAFSEKVRRRLQEANQALQASEAICRAMIRRVIELGAFPQWDELVLGV